jgi:hypothetical protein
MRNFDTQILFIWMIMSIGFTSCFSDSQREINSLTDKLDQSRREIEALKDSINKLNLEKKKEDQFTLQPFNLSEVSDDMKDKAWSAQIGAGGCVHSKPKSDLIYMYGGLVKINGVFEILQEKSNGDFSNKKWLVKINCNNYPNCTIKLKNILNGGYSNVQVESSCGT